MCAFHTCTNFVKIHDSPVVPEAICLTSFLRYDVERRDLQIQKFTTHPDPTLNFSTVTLPTQTHGYRYTHRYLVLFGIFSFMCQRINRFRNVYRNTTRHRASTLANILHSYYVAILRGGGKLVGWLEFNVPFQHKCGYVRDEGKLVTTVRVMLPYQGNPCTDCKSAQQCTTRGHPLPLPQVTSVSVQ